MSQRPFPLIVPAHHDEDDHDDHGGLHRDLRATGGSIGRRRALRLAARWGAGIGASMGALSLFGCSTSHITGATGTDTSTGTGATTSTGAACPTRIPEETAGPYPGDSSNGPNVLDLTGVVRQDIRSSFAGLSGTAAGVPLTIDLTLVSASSCAALSGYAVYLWHCTANGLYSLYSAGATNQNYLRGVQAADANGKLSFTSIFPGCYAGRWPHIHFEVYQSLTAATSVRNKIATSQLALPKTACDAVYATSAYASSAANLKNISLATDMVFADGASLQLAPMTGSASEGYTAALTVAVAGA